MVSTAGPHVAVLVSDSSRLFRTEIVGTALRVGPKVSLIKAGQRVGVGAQSYSCLNCRQCKNENETYCPDQLDTYGAKWPDTGIISQGGYSSHVRTHEHWCVDLPSSSAPPLSDATGD